MKRLLSVLLIALLIIPTIAVPAMAEQANAISFKDVDSTTTQGQAIIKLATAGVLLGYPDGTFKPNQPITRGELSKVINKIFNYTEADTEMFADVDKTRDWYYNEVAIAKKAGYIKGYDDGTFRGENNMTREEACTILTRVGGMYDLGIIYPIKDAISEWAIPYVNMIIVSGFMSLEADNTFRATEKITRGEFCEAFSKFVQIKEEVTPPEEDKKEEDKKEENTVTPGNNGSTGGNNSSGSNNNSGNNNNDVEDEDPPEETPPVEEEPIDYAELNRENIEALNRALTELQDFFCVDDYETELVGIAIKCINKVLPNADKVEINDVYVEEVCAQEIEQARTIWKNMSVDEKNSFKQTTIPSFHTETVNWLVKFFGVYF